jgi:predicted metal-binding membrane protein
VTLARLRSPVPIAAALLAAALVTWIVTVERMRGMDAGPGTDLGGFAWYLGIWTTMMAAMMLPSVAPMVLVFHRVGVERAGRREPYVRTWVFALSYFAVWAGYGVAAYALYRLVEHADLGLLAWNRGGRFLAGGAIVAAGLYELTPLKTICLRHCRSPLHFVRHGWREGQVGAVRMGGVHGAYCVGCFWGLMVVLFALGVMSLTWMAVVASLIFAQKVLPAGERLTKAFAVAFVVAGIWVASAPGSVPGLTLPGSGMPGMHPSPAELNQMQQSKPPMTTAPMAP